MKEKHIDWKDVAMRAVKTFLQAAAAFAMAEISGAELFAIDARMWGAIGVSAVAAGLSAVWNGVMEPMVLPALSGGKKENCI